MKHTSLIIIIIHCICIAPRVKLGKASLKRWVLSFVFNHSSVGAFLMWGGNEFHREGPATGNALSPQGRCLLGPRDLKEVSISRSEALGGGVLVEEVGEAGGSQVVEGRVGGE